MRLGINLDDLHGTDCSRKLGIFCSFALLFENNHLTFLALFSLFSVLTPGTRALVQRNGS